MNNLIRITLVIQNSDRCGDIIKQIIQHKMYSTDKHVEIKINQNHITIQNLMFLNNTTLIDLTEFCKRLSIDYKNIICVDIKDYDDLDWNSILFDKGQVIMDVHTPMLDNAHEIVAKHVGVHQ